MDDFRESTLAVIMAGGAGARLRPLTDVRAKPAVPFAGHHRIIDFALSNCINSSLRRILVLTQYKSHSLSNHLKNGWSFLPRRLDQYIDEIPAQMQTGGTWYRGTADAIRQNQRFIDHAAARHVLVLAGDHVYKMDYRQLKAAHDERDADITVVVTRVDVKTARRRLGVVEVDGDGLVVGFEEKPRVAKRLPGTRQCLASMGIYLFNRTVLKEVLQTGVLDFGRDFFSRVVAQSGLRIVAYDFSTHNRIAEYEYVALEGGQRVKQLVPRASDSDYWRDVGNLEDYWHAHLDLVATMPRFNLYSERWPLFTYPQHEPPAKFVHDEDGRRGAAYSSLVCGGVIISGATVRRSVICPGTHIHSYSEIESSVLLGGLTTSGAVHETSIGRRCRIRNAIIDRHVSLSPGTVIGFDRAQDAQRKLTTVDLQDSGDYIVVVPRNSVL